MHSLDDMKQSWTALIAPPAFDEASMRKLIKSRVGKHTHQAYHYFWGSFAMQIIFYALMCHLVVRFWGNTLIVVTALSGVVLFIPFTVILLTKFKRMAAAPLRGIGGGSVLAYLNDQREQLQNILKFKMRYEIALVPLINAAGIILPIAIYWPDMMGQKMYLAITLYAIALLASFLAMRVENKKSFIEPIKRLDAILKEGVDVH